MSILFTTGATVTFRQLLDYVAEPEFFSFLQSIGFSKIALQYGNESNGSGHVSKKFVSDVMAKNQLVEKMDFSIQNSTNDKSVVVFANSTLELLMFAFSPTIGDLIAEADIVVSHAGTGSILDCLRLGKPLLVVTNNDLMDDHQEEVASQFENEGYLYRLSTAEMHLGKLRQYLLSFKKGLLRFVKFPPPPEGVVESVLVEELQKQKGAFA